MIRSARPKPIPVAWKNLGAFLRHRAVDTNTRDAGVLSVIPGRRYGAVDDLARLETPEVEPHQAGVGAANEGPDDPADDCKPEGVVFKVVDQVHAWKQRAGRVDRGSGVLLV